MHKSNNTFFSIYGNGYFVKWKICEKCGAPMKIRISKYGEFLGCSNYPNCKYKKTLYVIGKEKF